jgi:hypothetical protein
MALVAAEVILKDDRVVKPRSFRTQVFPDMAVRAAGDLGVVLAGLKVADEAAAFRHRDVVSLDDLGMTARAAQLLAPSQVSQVDPVVENDRLELDPAFEEPLVMASHPETALVRDLGPGLGLDIELCPVAEDLVEAFELDPQEGPHPRRIVALAALDARMSGLLPALVEGLHVVAYGAELVLGSVLGQAGEKKEYEDKNTEGDEESLLPGLLFWLYFFLGWVRRFPFISRHIHAPQINLSLSFGSGVRMQAGQEIVDAEVCE